MIRICIDCLWNSIFFFLLSIWNSILQGPFFFPPLFEVFMMGRIQVASMDIVLWEMFAMKKQ